MGMANARKLRIFCFGVTPGVGEELAERVLNTTRKAAVAFGRIIAEKQI